MKLKSKDKNFLIVDDNQAELRRMAAFIADIGGECSTASTLADAQRICDMQRIDCLITDIHLDQKLTHGQLPDGIKLLKFVKEHHPQILAMACSGDPRLDTYQKAVDAGAMIFMSKPILTADAVLITVTEASKRRIQLTLDRPMDLPGFLKDTLARYPEGIVLPNEARRIIEGFCNFPTSTLMISGETGTGKEQMAKLLHIMRVQKEGVVPFIPVNCAGIDPSLAMSLIFGHKRGAFSGASETTNGYIGEANGGILFLDEIHALDLKCQQKLLRVLNDGSYERLGDSKPLSSKFQLVTASTKALEEEVKEGRFLLDLFMRLGGGLELQLQPLRARPHDIAPLVALFLSQEKLQVSEDEFRRLCRHLQEHKWPGNIRQLFKVLQSWVLTAQCQGQKPSVDYLPFIADSFSARPVTEISGSQDPAVISLLRDSLRSEFNMDSVMDSVERALIESAIAKTPSIGDAARYLGLSRGGLDTRRRRLGLA